MHVNGCGRGELKTLTIFPHVQVNLVFGHAVSAELLDAMESVDGVEAPYEEGTGLVVVNRCECRRGGHSPITSAPQQNAV